MNGESGTAVDDGARSGQDVRSVALYVALALGLSWVVFIPVIVLAPEAWHLPLFVLGFDAYADGNFAIYLLTLIGLAVIYTFLWNRSRGSVIVVMIMHGAINASGALVLISEADAASSDVGFAARVAMSVTVLAFAAVLLVRHGRDLGGAPPPPRGVSPGASRACSAAASAVERQARS